MPGQTGQGGADKGDWNMRQTVILACLFIAFFALISGAYASDYSFWGITMGQESYAGRSQVTFSGVGSTQYIVGGYPYSKVDGAWYQTNDAPSPGTDYAAWRAFDAQAMFFRGDSQYAHFAMVGGCNPNGVTFGPGGYGDRQFGPGDLRINIGGSWYGVGVRQGGLKWYDGDNAQFKIYRADTMEAAAASTRDAGNVGVVERNPIWYHADHAGLAPVDNQAYAFFAPGSGTNTGAAVVSVTDTGVNFDGYDSFMYEVAVPWAALGYTDQPTNTTVYAQWMPDCGNDYLGGNFRMSTVPEPSSVQLLVLGIGVVGFRFVRRRK